MFEVVRQDRLVGLVSLLLTAGLLAVAAGYGYMGLIRSRTYHRPSRVWVPPMEAAARTTFGSASEAQWKGCWPRGADRPAGCDEGSSSEAAFGPIQGRWVRVIDGGTLVVQLGRRHETVRLLGVYTFEASHPLRRFERLGKEALGFVRRLAEGKQVRLEFDRRPWDRWGRLLAYAYLPDGTLLNAEVIRQGYGFTCTRYPCRYREEFRRLEEEARERRRGLWGRRAD